MIEHTHIKSEVLRREVGFRELCCFVSKNFNYLKNHFEVIEKVILHK